MPAIEMIIQEIERALDAQLYYLAITVALTLPDVCSALEAPDGRTNPDLYRKWCSAHLKIGGITPDDCYSLRCGVIHQGQMGVKGQLERFLFTTVKGNPRTHNVIMNAGQRSAVAMDAEEFCRDFIAATRVWFAAKKNDPIVEFNLPGLVHYRPEGLAPFFVGIPIIA